jgi:glycosyltransferase involved in cell wall biosynthesis
MTFFNRQDILRRTLAAYFNAHAGHLDDAEFIILDDGSEHRAATVAKEFSKRMNIKLFYRELKDDINPAVAINSAVRLASHEHIILTSSDVMPLTPVIQQFSKYTFLQNDYVSINCYSACKGAQDKINSLDTNSLTYVRDIQNMFQFKPKGPSIAGDDSWYSHPVYRPELLYFMSLMKKQFFWDIGGIDEDFRYGTAYEDTEFCHRLKKYNARAMWLLEGLSIHQYHYGNSENQEVEKWTRNRDIYFEKVKS